MELGLSCSASFHEDEKRLTTAPILGYPDPNKAYLLVTYANKVGIGALLSQVQHGDAEVIAYYNKTLVPSDKNYCVTRKAMGKALKYFRSYFYGYNFCLRTGHASLQ